MPSRFQEMLRLQRQNAETARAGLMWESEEENRLIELILNGTSLEEIAKDFQRTDGSIKTRLYTIVCQKIDAGEEDADTAYNKYKVTHEEVEDFRQKKQKREEKQQQRLQNKKPRRAVSQLSNRKDVSYSSNQSQSYDDVSRSLRDIRNDLNLIKYHLKIH
jgi:hypothetical protein